MRYPNREELMRMGLAVFAVYLGIYYWTTVAHWIVLLLQAIYPVVLGCAIAYVVNIPMCFFERRLTFVGQGEGLSHRRRTLSLLVTIAIGTVAIAFLVRFIVPELVQSVRLISSRLPQLAADARRLLSDLGLDSLLGEELDQLNDWKSVQAQLSSYFTTAMSAGGVMGSVARGLTGALSSSFEAALGSVLAIYMLMTKERLCAQVRKLADTYLGRDISERIQSVGSVFDRSFHSFIVGRSFVSVLLGIMCLFGMLVFRFPYAMTISTVVGVTYLVPVVGALVGAAVGGLLIFSVSPMQALLFLIFLLVLEQTVANVIFPHVVGSATGLPSIWVLVAVTIGGGIGGIPVILMSVPVAAAIYQLLSDDVHERAGAADEQPCPEPVAIDEAQ